jgi:hypothetical protein
MKAATSDATDMEPNKGERRRDEQGAGDHNQPVRDQ